MVFLEAGPACGRVMGKLDSRRGAVWLCQGQCVSEHVFQVASWRGSSVTTPMAGPPLAASCSSWLLPWYVYNLNAHVLVIRFLGPHACVSVSVLACIAVSLYMCACVSWVHVEKEK